jgi:hypothetical protein
MLAGLLKAALSFLREAGISFNTPANTTTTAATAAPVATADTATADTTTSQEVPAGAEE